MAAKTRGANMGRSIPEPPCMMGRFVMDVRELSDEKLASILTFFVTFGYIDGAFDPAEQRFVSEHMHRLLAGFVDAVTPDARQRAAVHARISRALDAVYER